MSTVFVRVLDIRMLGIENDYRSEFNDILKPFRHTMYIYTFTLLMHTHECTRVNFVVFHQNFIPFCQEKNKLQFVLDEATD